MVVVAGFATAALLTTMLTVAAAFLGVIINSFVLARVAGTVTVLLLFAGAFHAWQESGLCPERIGERVWRWLTTPSKNGRPERLFTAGTVVVFLVVAGLSLAMH